MFIPRYLKLIKNLINFVSLPKQKKQITFYSEGKNYWPNFENLISKLLNDFDITICYLTSDEKDPGLKLIHKNYKSFEIDDGYIRNWVFENIDTYVFILTMPDLGNYQLKKSKYKVHYIYLQHSLISLHMGYRKGAFDNFDTIFCAGPHHKKEILAQEKLYKLTKKNLINHGYARLDIIHNFSKKSLSLNKTDSFVPNVIIAPSWGANCLVESGIAKKIINKLLSLNCNVTLRPHPETIKHVNEKIKDILKSFEGNMLFNYEGSICDSRSLYHSDLMVSDWSGAALDYAFGLKKPVLFINVPKKINNPDYQKIGIEPFEVDIREKIGKIVNNIEQIKLTDILDIINKNINYDIMTDSVYNLGKSDVIGSKLIYEILIKNKSD